jgi:hypothetical protein
MIGALQSARRALVALGSASCVLALVAVACGGSASETPYPLEPIGNARSRPKAAPTTPAADGTTAAVAPAEEALPQSEPITGPAEGSGAAPSTWGTQSDSPAQKVPTTDRPE